MDAQECWLTHCQIRCQFHSPTAQSSHNSEIYKIGAHVQYKRVKQEIMTTERVSCLDFNSVIASTYRGKYAVPFLYGPPCIGALKVPVLTWPDNRGRTVTYEETNASCTINFRTLLWDSQSSNMICTKLGKFFLHRFFSIVNTLLSQHWSYQQQIIISNISVDKSQNKTYLLLETLP